MNNIFIRIQILAPFPRGLPTKLAGKVVEQMSTLQRQLQNVTLFRTKTGQPHSC
jgi:hypothetical protein